MDWAKFFRRRSEPVRIPQSRQRFGYAVVGLGRIAEYFLDALAESPTCVVSALVSGSPDKAHRLAAKYGVPHILSYAEFNRLGELSAVDAVYLALPVSMHRQFTERAAAAGKHVLCEKPMASTAADAAAMVDACKSAAVRLSIAYRCPYTVVHQQARQLVRTGALGSQETLRIASAFGFKLGPDWRADGSLAGGGSLYDVGIYPLNASRYLLGQDPTGVRDASAVCDANGLEQTIAWTSVFPSGATAVCRSSYLEKLPDTLRITGESGTLLLAPAFSHRERMEMDGSYTDQAGKRVAVKERVLSGTASQFRLEAEHLAKCVRLGSELITPGEDGLADMIAMEAIYRAACVPVQSSAAPLS